MKQAGWYSNARGVAEVSMWNEIIRQLSETTEWLERQQADPEGNLDPETARDLIDRLVNIISLLQLQAMRQK